MKTRRIGGALLCLAVLGVLLVACSTAKPTPYRMAYVLGAGTGDAREVKKIAMPGNEVSKDSDDDVEYIYANARNWNIQDVDGADSQKELMAPSKPSDDGKTPGYTVHGSFITYFAINRPDGGTDECLREDKNGACRALFAFYQYCQKYNCTTGEDNESDDPKEQAMSSDPGWMNMLRESLNKALEHAYVQVVPLYDVFVINDPSKWPEIAKQIADRAFKELPSIMGMSEDLHIFCSTAIISSGGKCEPFTVVFNSLTSPEAQSLLTQRRDNAEKSSAELARIADEQRVEDARVDLERSKAAHAGELYSQPGYSAERQIQSQQELLQACKDAPPQGGATPNCVVIVGGDSGTDQQLQLQVGQQPKS